MAARTPIRPHGEEARVRDAPAVVQMFRARAVSNHEGGPCIPTSSFETQRTVGKCRLFDAPQDEAGTGSRRGASVKGAIAFTLAEVTY